MFAVRNRRNGGAMNTVTTIAVSERKRPFAFYARSFADHEYVCSTWFERDRKMVSLATPNGRVIFELWDDQVDEAVESGYLPMPRRPRPTDADWQPCAVAYARDMGHLKTPARRAQERKRDAAKRSERYWARRALRESRG